MKHSSVAASISVWVGVITALLLLIDAAITEAQRKKLKEYIEAAWVWLDDQRAERFDRPIRNYKVQLIAAAAVHVLFVFSVTGDLLFHFPSAQFPWTQLLGALVSASLFAWWVIPLTVKWITSTATTPATLGRAWLVSVAACLPFYILNAYPIAAARHDSVGAIHWFFFSHETQFYRGLYIPFLASIFFLIILIILSCVVVWILLAFVAILRFLFLRIAENPKGPVIGFSLFFVALGLLLKAFLPS